MSMDIHKLQYPDHTTTGLNERYSVAVGFFDGLHKGHQAVIRAAQDKAVELGIRSAVMTFDPHPSHLFGGGNNKVSYITQFPEKVRLLQELGVDTLFVVTFDWALASLTPEQFIEVFIKGLGIEHVTGGFDFTFGSKGAGTMEMMESLSGGAYGTTVVGKVSDGEEKVSSTRIRELLEKGDVSDTAHLLGRPFRTIGTVGHGDKRGRLLGFPTANLVPEPDTLLPANGVYAVRFSFDNQTMGGVCNVGVKPTFQNPDQMRPSVEVHVLDFEGDLYGKEVAVDWIAHIRAERKFDSVDALVRQIGLDKETAKELLAKQGC